MPMSIIKKMFSFSLLETSGAGKDVKAVKYPGVRDAVDGNTAVVHVEREASDAAGAYPITPSTQMGEYWAAEVAAGHLNISDKPLIFIEPESEHAAAGVTAGMAMTGLRAVNFSSGQGVAFMHESLYGAVGKRLPYVLNMGCRAITKVSLNVHAGHDDYHCVDDTGFIQVMAKNDTEAADLNLIGRKLAELSLSPAIIRQDGFLPPHLTAPALLPDRRLRVRALGALYGLLLLCGLVPLVIGIFLAGRYAPVLSEPALLEHVWSSLVGVGRVAATVVNALFAGAGRFVIEQPAIVGWLIILAGLVFLWGGVFQRLLAQPAAVESRN